MPTSSLYLFDKLTFEQKKILVSEFYNISQELKYKILNTNDKLSKNTKRIY